MCFLVYIFFSDPPGLEKQQQQHNFSPVLSLTLPFSLSVKYAFLYQTNSLNERKY